MSFRSWPTLSERDESPSDPWSICKSVLANPLIISVIVAAPFAYFQLGVPGWLEKSMQYLADTTLPLALICIGGTLSLAALRKSGVDAAVVRYLGVGHDTPIYTGALPAALVWHEQVISALRRLHD